MNSTSLCYSNFTVPLTTVHFGYPSFMTFLVSLFILLGLDTSCFLDDYERTEAPVLCSNKFPLSVHGFDLLSQGRSLFEIDWFCFSF